MMLPGLDAQPGRDPITITLQPCGTLLGRVLVEVIAMIRHERLSFGGLAVDVVRTDVDGRFRITGLIAGVIYRLGGLDLPQRSLGDITVRIGEVKDMGDIKDERPR